MEQALLDEMKQTGVQVERFHEPEWSQWNKPNNRTHRKLLVVDGRIGYTGGGGHRRPLVRPGAQPTRVA